MRRLIRLFKELVSNPDVLPPPCKTVDRDPYSKQFEYIRRVSKQV